MIRVRSRFAIAALVAGLALGAVTLTACGSAQDAIENAAGDAIGGDVNLEEGELSVTDSEGNSIQLGENVSLPDNWPAEVPAYDGGSLMTVVVSGDGATVNAVWLSDASPEDAMAAYSAILESAGYTKGDVTAAAGMSTSTFTGNGYTVTVLTMSSDSGSTVTIEASKA
jgi:hypothetical protein